MSMIQDRVMTPLVAQAALFSALDATGRTLGPAAYTVRSRLDFESGAVTLDNSYSGDVSVSAVASAGLASPLAYALSSGFDALRLKGIRIDANAVDRRSQLQIASVVAPRQVRPGGDLPIVVVMAGDNGVETSKTVVYRVPVGAPAGTLSVTVADAATTNLLEYQTLYSTPAHSPAQVLGLLNGLKANTSAWVRVWRNETDYTVEGRDLPDPPPSIALILGRAQAGNATALNRGSKVAEIEIAAGAGVVTGSKTVQVEVKE
jgi:hypothetical protein